MKTFLITLILLFTFSLGYSQNNPDTYFQPTIVNNEVNVPILQQASIHLVKGQRMHNGAIASYTVSSIVGGSLLLSSINSTNGTINKNGVVIGSVIMGAGALNGFIMHLIGNNEKSKGFHLMGNGFGVRF
jgi:hypothetical protein